MKHIGSTLLLLVSIGLLVLLLPHLQYTTKVSASQESRSIPKTTQHIITKIPTPTIAPSLTIQTVSINMPVGVTTMPTPIVSGTFSLDGVQTTLLAQVNNYRKSQGLSTVSANKTTCDFATLRAQEITASFSHQGFDNRVSSKTLPYPSYSIVVENLAMNGDQQQVVSNWISSTGHSANMRAETPYGCIGHSGTYYVYEGWRP